MERTNFNYLLAALVVFLAAVPLTDDHVAGSPDVVKAILFSTVMIIGVRSLKGAGRIFLTGMLFAVSGVILSVLSAQFESVTLQFASLLALVGFVLVASLHTLRQVAFGIEINANRLTGAVCVYLLLGVLWALAYSVLELAVPGSFAGFDAWHHRGWDSEWLYFSFVTMTMLGYGDLLPISATARALAYAQAVVGQFYIAILVAGLVGAYISRSHK